MDLLQRDLESQLNLIYLDSEVGERKVETMSVNARLTKS